MVGAPGVEGVATPDKGSVKKIMLDLSTALGEYSSLENTPLSPPTQTHRGHPRSFIERVDESDHM
jgi:hypothetical protein